MSVFIKFIVCLLIACEKLFSLFRAQNYLLLISCTNLKAKQQSKKKKTLRSANWRHLATVLVEKLASTVATIASIHTFQCNHSLKGCTYHFC